MTATLDELVDGLRHRVSDEVRRQLDSGLAAGMQVVVADVEQTLVDLAVGVAVPSESTITPATRFPLYSASKPFVATAVHRLVADGRLGYDDRVTEHIPEFGKHGKEDILLRHVLTHRAGIPRAGLAYGSGSWDEQVAAVCDAVPLHPPGERVEYHVTSAWLVLAEILQRIDGRPFADVCTAEVLEPLGMTRTGWSRPADTDHTAVAGSDDAMQAEADELAAAALSGLLPGGGAWGTAQDLARFYQCWLSGGVMRGGERLLPEPLTQETSRLHAPFAPGRTIGFGLGFIVGSDAAMPTSRGARLSGAPFGHPGWCATLAVADPERGVVIAATANGAPPQDVSDRRFSTLCDLVAEAIPPRPGHRS